MLADGNRRTPAICVSALTRVPASAPRSAICFALQNTGVTGSPVPAPPRGACAIRTTAHTASESKQVPANLRMKHLREVPPLYFLKRLFASESFTCDYRFLQR